MATVKSLLLRRKKQRCREGSRHASASHGTRSASSTGSGDRCALLPVEGAVQKSCTADELCDPSRRTGGKPTQRRRGQVGERARRRALCARRTRSMPLVTLRVPRHACTHDSLTLYTVRSAQVACMSSQAAQGHWWSHILDSMTGQVVGS